jgi:hypothetical protein
MKSGVFVPPAAIDSGPPDAPDAPCESSGTGEMPGIGGALVLPVLFTVAAWAVDRFTRSGLGDWRYVPTAVLGLCAFYFTVLAVIVIAVKFSGPDGERPPGRLARVLKVLFASKTLFTMVLAAAVGLGLVRAVHNHSAVDVVTALLFAVLFGLVPLIVDRRAMSRRRRYIWAATLILLPVWLLVVSLLHLS